MPLFLLLVTLATCAANRQNLSGKMFLFPQETNTAHVRLIPSRQDFDALTICLRYYTDLSRDYSLFSLSMSSFNDVFLIFKRKERDVIAVYVRNINAEYRGHCSKPNAWHSVCSTWDSASGLVQLWFNGKPSMKKYVGGSKISHPIIILGQEQDSYGGKFDKSQSFTGMMSDVNMWDYVLLPCQIEQHLHGCYVPAGNLLNWQALHFQIRGRVLIERKKITCHESRTKI